MAKYKFVVEISKMILVHAVIKESIKGFKDNFERTYEPIQTDNHWPELRQSVS